MSAGETTASFAFPGLRATSRVEVIGEGREVSASAAGSFEDAFGGYDVHLYRVTTP
jgi:hypothetical protein